jgi:high-affinity iron transporter
MTVLAPAPASGAPPSKVVISTRACGEGWQPPRSGQRIFAVDNTTKEPYEVELVGANQLRVYADQEVVGPRTTVSVAARLSPGTYSWRCTALNGTVSYSTVARVRGAKTRSASFIPATYSELQAATVEYRSAVSAGLTQLATDTDALTQAVVSGNLDGARTLWLPAHLDYERLGAVYGTFGVYDQAINGLPSGLVGGVNSPKFAGFHRLEYGLWGGQPAAALVPVADALDASVHALQHAFPRMETPPTDVALRTHEILENALQFEMTGETDFGSHTNLATVAANVAGTQMTLAAITSLLARENPAVLHQAQRGLAGLAADLERYDSAAGTWTPLQDLTQAQREALDGTLSELLEHLAPIPGILNLPPSPNDDE